MTSTRWINKSVEIDMATGDVLAREGYFYVGPIARLEGATAEQLQADLEAAAKARDEAIAETAKLRKQMADLQKGVMSEEDKKLFEQLKADAAKSEEERLRKAGEFDKMTAQLTEKHAKDLEAATAKAKQLEATLRKTLVGREFAGANALFGKAGKTILTPQIAEAYYGRYVEVQDVEGSDEKVVVVKNAQGQIILNPKTGKPAAFAEAMSELIESMPDKDSVLRGSGQTGSGNSGGAGAGGDRRDLANPKSAADFQDPKVREEVKKKHNAAGGIQAGSVFDKR